MTLTAHIARGVRRFVRDYRLNWIYASPSQARAVALPPGLEVRPITVADRDQLARSTDAQVRKALGYAATEAEGYVLAGTGTLLGVVHYCRHEHYEYAAIWPLGADQLALVDIVMLPAARGRGLAPPLIAAATAQVIGQSTQASAVCFIWWNHHASLRAFRRAGWRAIGFSVEITRRTRARWVRWRWPA